MRIAVFGASGKVGRQVVALALENGHEINAFVHSQNPFENNSRIKVLKGNVKNPEAVEAALKDSEAVVCALGSWGTQSKNIVSSGMKSIIPAMEEQGVERLVTVTGAGAFWSQDRPSLLARVGHSFIKLFGAKVLADSEEHLRLLEASRLEWTCVRSPVMTRGKKIDYDLSFKSPTPWALIPRTAVAECLLDLAESREYRRQAPFIKR